MDADGESINGEEDSEVEDTDNTTLLLISNIYSRNSSAYLTSTFLRKYRFQSTKICFNDSSVK